MTQSSNTIVLTELYYLPSLNYFAHLLPYSIIRIEKNRDNRKRSEQNKCSILTSQGVHRLTIPVHQSSKYRKIHPYIAIDHSQLWARRHWRTLCTSYSRAPYFVYFADYFHAILQHEYTYLFELNLALLRTCLRLLQLKKEIFFSISHKEEHLNAHHRTALHHTSYNHVVPHTIVPYPQVFGSMFHANLSIIDLLFCQGRESIEILKQIHKRMVRRSH